jgi:NADH dehydrogenase
MKIAITGATGFVGGQLARSLHADGHDLVLIGRPREGAPEVERIDERQILHRIGLDDTTKLAVAFAGCDAIAHCAGINRQIGRQTYRRVHVEGTRHVVEAAKAAGVRKVLLVSFLRARPNCGSKYHESKWQAEEIVRFSGLDYTVFKPGVIYGRGDHMLDHLSRAFHTFPVFGLVGLRERCIRPLAIRDLVRVMTASVIDGRLSRQTVSITGPEEMNLGDAVRRVAAVLGKRPLFLRLPIWFHYALAWLCERLMRIPLISIAQVRILSEGLTKPLPFADDLSLELLPATPFSETEIRHGLPEPGPFTCADLRCCTA